jgi:hypothetical protein
LNYRYTWSIFPFVLWNNVFLVMVVDDDGALSLGGHSFTIVEVSFGMLKAFS